MASYPTKKSIDLVASCAAENEPSDKRLTDWYRSHAERHLERIAYDLDLVTEQAQPVARILEIGACPLLLTIPLKRLAYDLQCIDLAPARFERSIAENRIEVYRYDIERLEGELPQGPFDLILFNEVFEHLRFNPIATIGLIRSLLDADGRLLLSTPNLRSIEGITNLLFFNRGYALAGEIAEEFGKIEAHGHCGHVREYTPGDVCRFLESSNFEIERIIYRGKSRRFGAIGAAFARLFPPIRPFFTVVARLRAPGRGPDP